MAYPIELTHPIVGHQAWGRRTKGPAILIDRSPSIKGGRVVQACPVAGGHRHLSVLVAAEFPGLTETSIRQMPL
jgi:hypothetical protein